MLTLLVFAGLCVPLMLLVKPFWYHFLATRHAKSDDYHNMNKLVEDLNEMKELINKNVDMDNPHND